MVCGDDTGAYSPKFVTGFVNVSDVLLSGYMPIMLILMSVVYPIGLS